MILNSDSNNIFQSLSMEDYRRVMKVVESAILSTDLAVYFKKKNKFMELIDEGEFDWQSEEKKERKIKQLCIITIKKKAIERSRRNIYI